MDNRAACSEQALGVAVAGSVTQIVDHVLHDFFGRLKAKRCGIADIQLDNAVAFILHFTRSRQHRAANVVAHVVELGGFEYGLHFGLPVR